MPTYFERYKEGQHQQVWQELIDLGSLVRTEQIFPDAYAVAQETMQRVRHNTQIVIERLNSIGFQFTDSDRNSFTGTFSSKFIEPVEKFVGDALPLSLRAFYEVIDHIDLTGTHQKYEAFQYEDMDALLIYPLGDPTIDKLLIKYDWEDFDEEYDYYDEPRDESTVPFFHTLSPDSSHKANMSGGPSYGMLLPNLSIDGKVEGNYQFPHIHFVDYLRRCFMWGGFPGFEFYQDETAELVQNLKEGLLQF